MTGTQEQDARSTLGYSVRNPEKRAWWTELVQGIAEFIETSGHGRDIVFHGTSSKWLPAIMSDGMCPTDIALALPDGMPGDGSFWGDVWTAAAYAEDTAKMRHPGSRPVLLAARTSDLLSDCQLFPDIATMDFPLMGLTRLEEPAILEKWMQNWKELPWTEGLDDLRAIVAVHPFMLPPERFVIVDSVDDVHALAEVPGVGLR